MNENISNWEPNGGCGNKFLSDPYWWMRKNPPENPRVDETISNFPCLWMRIFPTGP
jgi:hypothetical protein